MCIFWFGSHTTTGYSVGTIVSFGEHQVHVVRRGRGGSVRLSIGKKGDIRLSAGVLVSDETITRFCTERIDHLVARWKQRPVVSRPDPTEEQLEWLSTFLPERYCYWSEKMGVSPLVPFSWSWARSYWGKCYPSRPAIVFSRYLAALSPELVDYVIVHELAHLEVPHHNRAFYALVEQYIPDYKACIRHIRYQNK